VSAQKESIKHMMLLLLCSDYTLLCWQIAGLDASTSSLSNQLALLEHSAYEWQLKIFNSQIDIFTEEEQHVRVAIDNIKQQRAGLSLVFVIVCDK